MTLLATPPRGSENIGRVSLIPNCIKGTDIRINVGRMAIFIFYGKIYSSSGRNQQQSCNWGGNYEFSWLPYKVIIIYVEWHRLPDSTAMSAAAKTIIASLDGGHSHTKTGLILRYYNQSNNSVYTKSLRTVWCLLYHRVNNSRQGIPPMHMRCFVLDRTLYRHRTIKGIFQM